MPVKVFLSHASVDKPLVREVKTFLEQGGDIECWLDAVEIDFGDNASQPACLRVPMCNKLNFTDAE